MIPLVFMVPLDNLAKATREGQIDTVHSPLSCISISTAGIAVLEVLNLLISKYNPGSILLNFSVRT